MAGGRKIDRMKVYLFNASDSEVKPSELNQLDLACLHNIKPINKHE